MSKIEWQVDQFETVGQNRICRASELSDGYNQGSGVKRSSKLKLGIKRLVWPLLKLRDDLLVDGFIEREIARLIAQYNASDSVFFEVGCGDMSLSKYVDAGQWYNALDLEVSELHIARMLKGNHKINLCLASAAEIPAPDDVASIIVSTETFEHIPEIDRSIDEIHRVAKENAKLICSIPNNYCHKYVRKGPHAGHINDWRFEEFKDYMEDRGFSMIEGFMKGQWVPLPLWLTKTSYQLPVTPKTEYHATNFFYVFNVDK